eukprot:c19292_g1_i1.p1 GENE.c19292_g1_i1~~c19292_g1_i1.p1  ORF type:complete len:111 (-),score=29.32 c19292_g1_i1:77-379(-)
MRTGRRNGVCVGMVPANDCVVSDDACSSASNRVNLHPLSLTHSLLSSMSRSSFFSSSSSSSASFLFTECNAPPPQPLSHFWSRRGAIRAVADSTGALLDM